MRLSEVIAGTGARQVGGTQGDPEIARVTCDSRQAGPGALFFALAGVNADGARFAREAVEKGAVAVVSEGPLAALGEPAALLQAEAPRRAMALAAANFFGRPARALTMLGVSGTNGKTTTAYLAEAMLAAAGERPGVVGTVSYRFGGRELPAPNTTPESTRLQELLAQMRDAGTTSVAMEVSSHALAQERAFGIAFTSAAFTNLTRDHLDYHGDMESYFAAKRRLFLELLSGVATVNADDPYGVRLLDELTREGRVAWGFSARGQSAEIYSPDARFGIEGIEGTLVTPRGQAAFGSRLVGAHNLENILAATGLLLGAGFELESVVQGLAALENVPGRLERVSSRGLHLFVDYAHTDDALAHALAALRPLTAGRLLCVFGCGGDRDKGKRPLMGAAAAKGADLVVVTSDNPRTEEPQSIIDQILPGLAEAGAHRLAFEEARGGARGFLVESDRRQAIELAVSLAREGDVVLLAGKGHEDYQIVGTTKQHFDDREEARRALGVSP
ncbi:MAG TPA: UDP-N-acetylmuramoyl-L-alanyl-D-glutamate--2,6-diaminopimelate ligase [Myxococcales bacterium]|nr:UDP-N-acetylmuramoyl-L-alanyl-D-glutamate--2,6-diaminopimelate ligase [Myxococcales bacterium]